MKAKAQKPLRMREYAKLPAPFFGNKQLGAPLAWLLLDGDGEAKAYTEPFAGSCAMLLYRGKVLRPETVNDIDGMIMNFFRAVRLDPEGVARAALEQPVSEVDLHAWHHVMNRERRNLQARMSADPDYCQVRLAGAWLNGQCTWVAGNFGTHQGPWVVGADDEGVPVMCSRTGKGEEAHGTQDTQERGMLISVPHIGDDGSGIWAQVPHIGNDGRGIRAKIPHPHPDRLSWVVSTLRRIQSRIFDVRFLCGDWQRVISTDHIQTRVTPHAFFLDPPYDSGAQADAAAGTHYITDEDGGSSIGAAGSHVHLSKAAREWAAGVGHKDTHRIVICGRGAEHDELLAMGWRKYNWKARKGLNSTGSGAHGTEMMWASPHCPVPSDEELEAARATRA